ncbi:MAG: hypothetical protein AB9903_34335 [Vulcanimicrobiota bacterium]
MMTETNSTMAAQQAKEYTVYDFCREVKEHSQYKIPADSDPSCMIAYEHPESRKLAVKALAELRGITPKKACEWHRELMKNMIEEHSEDYVPDAEIDYNCLLELRDLQSLMLPGMFN